MNILTLLSLTFAAFGSINTPVKVVEIQRLPVAIEVVQTNHALAVEPIIEPIIQDTPIVSNGSNYIKWNTEKMCYDESNFPIFHDVPNNESLGYDPNWLVCTPNPDGCSYCMHPNQGHGNNPPDNINPEDNL